MKFFTAIVSLTAAVSAVSAAECADPKVDAQSVNPEQYKGKWYQVAVSSSVASVTQRACGCSVAEYALDGQNIKVKNTCTIQPARIPISITGTAKPATEDGKAIYRVDFDSFPVPRFGSEEDTSANYIVVKTWGGEDNQSEYDYALVGGRCKSNLFVLARKPQVSDDKYAEIQAYAESKGYNYTNLGVFRTSTTC